MLPTPLRRQAWPSWGGDSVRPGAAGGCLCRARATLSKRGSPRLHVYACVNGHSLSFPALTARHFNPLVKALGERLKQKGKAKMLILGAAMRKLLVFAYGVLKSGKPFAPNFAANAAPIIQKA